MEAYLYLGIAVGIAMMGTMVLARAIQVRAAAEAREAMAVAVGTVARGDREAMEAEMAAAGVATITTMIRGLEAEVAATEATTTEEGTGAIPARSNYWPFDDAV